MTKAINWYLNKFYVTNFDDKFYINAENFIFILHIKRTTHFDHISRIFATSECKHTYLTVNSYN